MRVLKLILVFTFCWTSLVAQVDYLSGPRFGVTVLSSSDFLDHPVITQYGWQLETRFFGGDESTVVGLVEWVALIGGMESGYFLPSLTSLVGVRNSAGFEFGVGPNVSLAGVGMAFSVGANLKSGNLNFPINFAVVPPTSIFGIETGSRFSIMLGFNMKR